MSKGLGYLRVSTEQQADSGLSLEAQRAKVIALAELQDLELVEIIVDKAESAKSLKRPGMDRLLELVDRREVETVVCYKLDRLTRSVRDLGELLERFERRGVSLVSVSESLDTGTAAGRLVLNVMASVAQWEREAIAERTREALQVKKAKGQRVGTIPFGFRVNGDGATLEEHIGEQKILKRIHRHRRAGQSLRRIAEQLNIAGFTTRSGTAWRHEYVYNLVRA